MPKPIMDFYKKQPMVVKGLMIYGVAAAIGELTGRYSLIPFMTSGQSYVDKRMPRSSNLARNILGGSLSKFEPLNTNVTNFTKGLGGFRLSALPDPEASNNWLTRAEAGGVWDPKLGYAAQPAVGFVRTIINRLRY